MSESFIPPRKVRKLNGKIFSQYTSDLKAKSKEELHERFDYLDSTLDASGDFMSFERSFRTLVPQEEEGLRSYIEHTLQEQKGDAVGIEFGGSGSRLFQSFPSGFFRQSIGVTLVEHRDEDKILDLETHKVILGDIRSDTTYEKIATELKGAKADLIVERMLGGWDYIENDPVLFGKILSHWYDLLAENGLLLAEAPPSFETIHKSAQDFQPLLNSWGEMLSQQYSKTIELRFGMAEVYGSSVFSLRKHPGAPETLPLLPIRSVIKAPER